MGKARRQTTWRRIAAGVWYLPKIDRKGHWCNTVAVRLTTGGLAIVSPTRGLGDAVHEALVSTVGQPELLVAPNHYHWMGIAEWQDRYTDTRAIASARAGKRLAGKVDVPLGDLTGLRERLPPSISILEPPGTRNGELWLRATDPDGSVLWVVGDAWFNFPQIPPGAYGLLCRAIRVGPGLEIGRSWNWLGVADRKAYRRWVLQELERSGPTQLLMSHGELVGDAGLADALIEQVQRRI